MIPRPALVQRLADLATEINALSDIQIEEGMPVHVLSGSGWRPVDDVPVTQDELLPLLNAITKEWKSLLSGGTTINRSIEIGHHRFRAILYTTYARKRVAVSLRLLPDRPRPLESLGLPLQVAQFCTVASGLLLVAGATGAGKSTTMAAIVDSINRNCNCHIVTIEDPIEMIHTCQQSVVTQREVGAWGDVPSFSAGVYQALRQRPDVLVIGEIRDAETAEAALLAAESGHYVIASVHARGSISALQKLMMLFPDNLRVVRASTLSYTLRGVIYQQLHPARQQPGRVVACEILAPTGMGTTEIVHSLLQPDKLAALDDKLQKGQIPGCLPISTSLKQLRDAGRIA